MQDGPIVGPGTPGWDEHAVGFNLNGPSLIRAPDWLDPSPGRYLLYFAHHQGRSIRLAFADALAGPWTIHSPGTLRLDQTRFAHHLASPDVHADHDDRRLVMYYHGCCANDDDPSPWVQTTRLAFSHDGLQWVSDDAPLCPSYLRSFVWRETRYGVVMPGEFVRMTAGWGGLETRSGSIAGALCGCSDAEITEDRKPRHFATWVERDTLHLFFSRAGDAPERVLHARVELTEDWRDWAPSRPTTLLEPERNWEGVDEPLVASQGGASHVPVRQLRDPAVFHDRDGRAYLLYSVAGERGIAIAELHGE